MTQPDPSASPAHVFAHYLNAGMLAYQPTFRSLGREKIEL